MPFPESTGLWEHLLPVILPEAAITLWAGPTTTAISGSLADCTLLSTSVGATLNDLWKFDPATGQWAWMSGSSTVGSNCLVIVGSILTAAVAARTEPWERLPPETHPEDAMQAETWVDSSGNFWLYGGIGFDANGNWGALSDLWRFNPSTNQWTWMGGTAQYR